MTDTLDKLIALTRKKTIERKLCCPECGDSGPIGGRVDGDVITYQCNACKSEFPSLAAMGSVEAK